MLKEKINGSEPSLNSIFLDGNKDFVNHLYAVIQYLEEFPPPPSASELGKTYTIQETIIKEDV